MNDLTLYLEQRPEVFQNSLLPNLAYTLGQRRSVLSYKMAIPARASAELIPALSSSDTVLSRATKEPRIGFVFTGQGAQWHAMGKELLDAYPVFASTLEIIDRCLAEIGASFSTKLRRIGYYHHQQISGKPSQINMVLGSSSVSKSISRQCQRIKRTGDIK